MGKQQNETGRRGKLIKDPKQAAITVTFLVVIALAMKFSLFDSEAPAPEKGAGAAGAQPDLPANSYAITQASWATDEDKQEGFVAPPGGLDTPEPAEEELDEETRKNREAAKRWQNLDIYRRGDR